MKFLSLILCILVPGSGCIALCPGEEGHAPEIHLIAGLCERHACNRTEALPEHACTDHDQSHEACGDQPVIDEYPVAQQTAPHILTTTSTVVIGDLLRMVLPTVCFHPEPAVLLCAPQRTPVLRI